MITSINSPCYSWTHFHTWQLRLKVQLYSVSGRTYAAFSIPCSFQQLKFSSTLSKLVRMLRVNLESPSKALGLINTFEST